MSVTEWPARDREHVDTRRVTIRPFPSWAWLSRRGLRPGLLVCRGGPPARLTDFEPAVQRMKVSPAPPAGRSLRTTELTRATRPAGARTLHRHARRHRRGEYEESGLRFARRGGAQRRHVGAIEGLRALAAPDDEAHPGGASLRRPLSDASAKVAAPRRSSRGAAPRARPRCATRARGRAAARAARCRRRGGASSTAARRSRGDRSRRASAASGAPA